MARRLAVSALAGRVALVAGAPLTTSGLACLAGAARAFLACGGPAFTEGNTPGDGGATASADGGQAGETGADVQAEATTPFCTPDAGYDFCADFDRSPLNVEWNDVNNAGGATGAIDQVASVSPPSSFLATSPPLSGDAGARSILTEVSLPKGATHIAFDLRIDELSFPSGSDPSASVIVAAYAQGANYILALELHPSAGDTSPFSAALLESTATVANPVPTLKLTPLPGVLTTVGLWNHVSIDFTIGGATTSVTATLAFTAGSPPTTSTKTVTLDPPVGTSLGAPSLTVGAQATAAVGQAKIRFDNVTYKH